MSNSRTVLICGCSGFIGSHLRDYLEKMHYHVLGLTRGQQTLDCFHWDPQQGIVPDDLLENVDVVINLAGENIAEKRWTVKRKTVLQDSRIASTRALVQGMSASVRKPSVFISMSGANYYSTGGTAKTENDPAGDSFLSRLCYDWESEAVKAEHHGIRVVLLRLGAVLDQSGGALKKMLPAYRLGFGGPLGSGKQGFPWITMDEFLRIIQFVMETDSISGPVNAVHPDQVSQAEFCRLLAGAIHRPAALKIPEWVVGLVFGEMGREVLLADLHVLPEKLLLNGYRFGNDNLGASLNHLFSS